MFFECGEKERATSFDLTLEPRRIFHPPSRGSDSISKSPFHNYVHTIFLFLYFAGLLEIIQKAWECAATSEVVAGLEINAYAAFDPALDIKTKSSKTFLQWAPDNQSRFSTSSLRLIILHRQDVSKKVADSVDFPPGVASFASSRPFYGRF